MMPRSSRSVAAGIAFALLAAVEGLQLADYVDPVGIPTICFGHTETAGDGRQLTQEGCENLLLEDVRKYQGIVLEHAAVPLNYNQLAAFTSWVYNVGEGAYRNSTLLKRLNAGDYASACREMGHWVYAKGKKLAGLARRRQQEMQLCLTEPTPW